MFGYVPNNSFKVHNIDFCTCMISGFRRETHENCPLLGYYATCCGNFLPTFRDRYVVPKRQYGISIIRCVLTQNSAVLDFSTYHTFCCIYHTLPRFTDRVIPVTFIWTILPGPDYRVGQPVRFPRCQSMWHTKTSVEYLAMCQWTHFPHAYKWGMHSTYEGVHFSQIDMAASKSFILNHFLSQQNELRNNLLSHNLHGDSEI